MEFVYFFEHVQIRLSYPAKLSRLRLAAQPLLEIQSGVAPVVVQIAVILDCL